MDDEDRISELPQQILHHHILSLLPQDVAVRTCVLSKSWRHLGPTRPKMEFHERDFQETKEKFLSVVENTLQRYDDQKLSVEEFVLSMILLHCPSNDSNSLLNKWNVKLHMLKRLSLEHVYIEEETFEKIMSTSCPSIEHLVLDWCPGLYSVKVNKAPNLKHLDCDFYYENCSFEININDALSLETIRINGCRNLLFHVHLHKNYFFPRLKSLKLEEVHLPTELLNNLWSWKNCPCLEELILHACSGFTEINLSNRSIKSLIIKFPHDPLTKVAIDAANLLYFDFTSGRLPSNVSFATAISSECKSRIEVCCSTDANFLSTWSLKLHEFLKALRHSQISLDIPPFLPLKNQDTYSCEHVVVEHLRLSEHYSSSKVPDLLNCMFRICRPRYIELFEVDLEQVKSIWKMLVSKGKTRQCHFWQQDLEESSIQVTEQKEKEWHPFQKSVLFRVKWRDLS